MNRRLRPIVATLAAGVLFASFTQRADAIGPSLLMFYGGTLTSPVYVSGAEANLFGNLLSPSTVASKDIAGRSYLKVAVFWGTQANPTGRGVALSDLKPEMAWQHGKYFPAAGSRQAVLIVTPIHEKKQQHPPDYSDGALFPWGGAVSPPAAAAVQAALTGSRPVR